jgi:hypothetical protein
LQRSGIEAGPIFRGMNRHGQILNQRLSGEAVSIILKEFSARSAFRKDSLLA